ncbi:MAG: hypothetical protein ACRDIZ_11130 [Actinomycetota bacterium]
MQDATADRSVRMKVVAVVAAALSTSTVGCSEQTDSAPQDAPAISSAGTPASPTAIEEADGPALTIISPGSGETVTAPVTIRYEILGVDVAPGMHLHAFVDSTTATPIEIPLRGSSGSAVLPGHPLLGGRRDLILQLARADHRPVEGARVVLHDLIIEGERVG